MDALFEHLQARWMAYAGVFICAAPVLYITRKYTVKALAWAVEVIIYTVGVHITVHFFVAALLWFKVKTVMHAIDQERLNPGWKTPLVEFWDRHAYIPSWIFYLEVFVFLCFTGLVLYRRPLGVQKVKEHKIHPARTDRRPDYRDEAR